MFLVLPLGVTIKVSVANRLVAKFIDLLIVFFLAKVLPEIVGPLVGFVYSLLADGINMGQFEGQSVGKKIMKLRVMNLPRKKPADFRDSALRNTPVGVATIFALIPFWGWIILALVGIPLMIMEIYLMVSVDSGHRLGDVMADTEVVEVKA
ncbi:MAG: RDD family protein [Bdellovibrio sp.]|nr:RDD family protein [Bdellovibrio sp.]